ncbi:DUF4272 domain-containing protein [Herbaspirillum sp. GCM10030257]|uniref:DUF4272 domain-containing protein n=1 Tax=Herbaspirillum sp. GCM10030257 TaxID=3273393 RepID=UPI0036235605
MEPINLREVTFRRFASWRLKANENLPFVESLDDLRPKSGAEVAARAIAAGYLAAFCFSAPAEKVRNDLSRFALWEQLTIDEQSLLSNQDASDQSKAFHSWLVESIQFMAWSLSLVPLDHFAPCSEALVSHFPKPSTDPGPFIANASLRQIDELLQEADTLYMLHWCAVEGNLGGQSDSRLNLPRISFRRHAADWVVGVAEAWADVPLDT